MADHLTVTYEVASRPITLTIILGNNQIGASAVWLDGYLLTVGDVVRFRLGTPEELIGREVTVKSLVSDVNDQTNKTIITYVLAGGELERRYQQAKEVANDGDSVVYRAKFRFERQ